MMKRCILFGVTLMLLLGLVACSEEPKETLPDVTVTESTSTNADSNVTIPEENYDMVYDMKNYQWFSDIFMEKTPDEWNDLGRHTMLLKGLHTPVVVYMDGASVLSVSAYDQTVDLGTSGLANEYDEGYSSVYYIRSTQDAVVIRVSGGEYSDDSILITKGRYFKYPNENDGDIFLSVEEDGTLGYRRTWLDPVVLEIEGHHALNYLTGRDMLLYQNGRAEIKDGEMVWTAEETAVVSDLFDLDTMFAEAKADGWFAEYETIDGLFEANKVGM